MISCGDVVTGTTFEYHDFTGSSSPDALYMLVTFDATHIALSTCNDVTSFDTVLSIYDGAPNHPNVTQLATSDQSQACGAVFFDAPRAGSYYVVVSGKEPDDAGLFQIGVACKDVPSSPKEETCGQQFLTCGDSTIGTNVGYANWAGGDSPDALYMITVFEATRIAISTCGSQTSFLTDLAIFDGSPASNGTELARASMDAPGASGCTTLIHDLDTEGAFFVTVEGRSADEVGVQTNSKT